MRRNALTSCSLQFFQCVAHCSQFDLKSGCAKLDLKDKRRLHRKALGLDRYFVPLVLGIRRARRSPRLAETQDSVSRGPLQCLNLAERSSMMHRSTIYFPVTCPCCGQEYVMVSNRNMIVNALATERQLTLSSTCAHHRAMWVANDIERDQIREYAETLHFLGSKQSRPRRHA
jgi:hypothetical protein